MKTQTLKSMKVEKMRNESIQLLKINNFLVALICSIKNKIQKNLTKHLYIFNILVRALNINKTITLLSENTSKFITKSFDSSASLLNICCYTKLFENNLNAMTQNTITINYKTNFFSMSKK